MRKMIENVKNKMIRSFRKFRKLFFTKKLTYKPWLPLDNRSNTLNIRSTLLVHHPIAVGDGRAYALHFLVEL